MRNSSLPCWALAALTAATLATVSPAQAQQTANVTVNANVSPGMLPPTPYGVNTAVWDGNLSNPDVPGLLRTLRVSTLRFPGGSTSDIYHWQTNGFTGGGNAYSNSDFDHFMVVANAIGAKPIITINYGSNSDGTAGGDPAEAAAWVKYSNVTKKYGVKYWEIGNEIYGNQEYGGDWEEDLHADQTPTAYGKNVVTFANAIKAVDPLSKVGVVLAAPNNWPDGVAPDWNTNVLAQCGKKIDFVILHWYPQGGGGENDASLLADPSQIASMVAKTRALIAAYCAPYTQIFVTETNSVAYSPGKQSVSLVNALYLADDLMGWLENGVSNVDWWDLHNGVLTGDNNSPSLYGTADYGDYGLLSVGEFPEPPTDTPFPQYYGMQMLGILGKYGDKMVSASSSQPLVAAHAVHQANGDLALLLINKDPANSYRVSVGLTGFTPEITATKYLYGENSNVITTSVATSISRNFTTTIAPYSLTTLILPIGAPAAPTNVTATPGIGKVVLTWTAPAGPVTQYYLYKSTTPGQEGARPIVTGITSTTWVDTAVNHGNTY